jgi:hypothetical protein
MGLGVALAGVGGGVAGHLLRPPPAEAAAEAAPPAPEGPREGIPLRDPFVVPILRDGRIWSHVVLSLGLEGAGLTPELVAAREPRLRDALNRSLWLHGSLGGFDGDFTQIGAMTRLSERLDPIAAELLEDPSARVLLIGLTRQDG